MHYAILSLLCKFIQNLSDLRFSSTIEEGFKNICWPFELCLVISMKKHFFHYLLKAFKKNCQLLQDFFNLFLFTDLILKRLGIKKMITSWTAYTNLFSYKLKCFWSCQNFWTKCSREINVSGIWINIKCHWMC